MEKIIDFVGDNYSWFLTITIILLFALIGYIYDTKRNRDNLFKKRENEIEEESLDKLVVPEGRSLKDAVVVSKNINPETKNVELLDETILDENKDIENSNNN